MPNVDLNGANTLVTIGIILIVLEALHILANGVDAWKKLTGKDARKKEMEEIRNDLNGLGARVTKCEERLRKGDKKFSDTAEDMGQVLMTLSALTMHFITGNDHERLRETNEELTEYMAKRATRKNGEGEQS
jgi:hypothetical protein